MRKYLYLGFIVSFNWFFSTQSIHAQAKEQEKPVLTIKVDSVESLIAKTTEAFKHLLDAALYDEVASGLPLNVDTLIPVLDTKKPAGLYAHLSEGALQLDLRKTYAVAMIPVKSEAETIEFLPVFELKAKKLEDGIYQVSHKKSPIPFFVRFVDGYAYICPLSSDPLSDKLRVTPKAFFGANTPIAEMQLFLDRIPKPMIENATQLIERMVVQFNEERKDHPLFGKYPEFILGYQEFLKSILLDTEDLKLSLDLVDPKKGMTFEASIKPKPNSSWANAIMNYPMTKNRFASLGEESLAVAAFRAPLFNTSLRNFVWRTFEFAFNDTYKGDLAIPKEYQEFYLLCVKSLEETILSGNMDAIVLFKPSIEGLYSILGAIDFKKSQNLAAWIEKFYQVDKAVLDEAHFKINPIEVKGLKTIHSLSFTADHPVAEKIFGKEIKVYMGYAEDALYIYVGNLPKQAFTEALKAKSANLPVVHVQLDGKKLSQFVETQNPKTPEAALKSLEKNPKLPLFQLHAVTGERVGLKADLGMGLFLLGFSSQSTIKEY